MKLMKNDLHGWRKGGCKKPNHHHIVIMISVIIIMYYNSSLLQFFLGKITSVFLDSFILFSPILPKI